MRHAGHSMRMVRSIRVEDVSAQSEGAARAAGRLARGRRRSEQATTLLSKVVTVQAGLNCRREHGRYTVATARG